MPSSLTGDKPREVGMEPVRSPHQLRHAHTVEMAREGAPLKRHSAQLGHANFGGTSVYLEGIDNAEIIDTVHARWAPMIPTSAGLRQPR